MIDHGLWRIWLIFPRDSNKNKNDKILGKNLNWHNYNLYSCKRISCIQKTSQDVGLNYIWISINIESINKVLLYLHNYNIFM